jgi:hypothetical protein
MASTWQSMTTPRASDASRIEMRLLRDTRRVLEYLSIRGCGQPCVYNMYETTKCRWALQLPEYISAVEQAIQIRKMYRMTRIGTNESGTYGHK